MENGKLDPYNADNTSTSLKTINFNKYNNQILPFYHNVRRITKLY